MAIMSEEKLKEILHNATLEIIKAKADPKEASQAALDWAIDFAMANAGSAELGGQMAVERLKELFGRKLHGRGISERIH
jgi:hypothetical protein